MALPPHAVVMYRYHLVGGVYDGQKQSIPHDVMEITVPAVEHGFKLKPDEILANMKAHGHGFPKGTKFSYYTSTGRTIDGHLVMDFTGYVDNPIQTPKHG